MSDSEEVKFLKKVLRKCARLSGNHSTMKEADMRRVLADIKRRARKWGGPDQASDMDDPMDPPDSLEVYKPKKEKAEPKEEFAFLSSAEEHAISRKVSAAFKRIREKRANENGRTLKTTQAQKESPLWRSIVGTRPLRPSSKRTPTDEQ